MFDFKTGQQPEAKDSGSSSAASAQRPAPPRPLAASPRMPCAQNETEPKGQEVASRSREQAFSWAPPGHRQVAPTRAGHVHELNRVLKAPVPSFFSTPRQFYRAVNFGMEFYLAKCFQVLKKDKNGTLATILHP